jgi:O-antigen/teichoic acid export membrane protein
MTDKGKVFAVRAFEMAKVSARAGFNLFWGLAASTVISALGVIIVAELLSPSELGVYTVALIAPNLIMIFRDWGVNTAMIKYIAQHNSENKIANVKSILIAGTLFEIILGLSLSVLSFLLAGFLATSVFQRPEMKQLIETLSFMILGGALVTAAQSVLIGLEKMGLNSVIMVLQSCLKASLMPLLIILGLGTFGATLGTTTALLIAGIIGILILLSLYKKLHKTNDDALRIAEDIKIMFKYGLPLSISAIIVGFLAQFYNFLMAIYATDLMIGNYSVATYFVVLITFFATPINTLLLPAFSKLNAQKDKETLRNVFQFSVKYASLLVVPVAAAVIALSQPGISAIFGQKYSDAPLFLALLAISYLYAAFGSLSIGNLINSQGKTKVNLSLTLVTSAIGFPLSIILIPKFGITGLIITTTTAGVPSIIIGLWWVRKYFGATVDWVSSAKILLASTTAAAITYIVTSQLSFGSWIKLIIGGTTFVFTFLIIAPLIRTINSSDVNNLRKMLSELGPISHLSKFLLDFMEKLITIFQS